jgi:hypothetical protein
MEGLASDAGITRRSSGLAILSSKNFDEQTGRT